MEQTILNTFFRFIKDHDLMHDFHYVIKEYSFHDGKYTIKDFLQICNYNPTRLIDYALPELIFGDEDYLSQKAVVMKTLWLVNLLNIPYCSVNMSQPKYKFIQRVLNSYVIQIDKTTLLNYLMYDDDLIILDYI